MVILVFIQVFIMNPPGTAFQLVVAQETLCCGQFSVVHLTEIMDTLHESLGSGLWMEHLSHPWWCP